MSTVSATLNSFKHSFFTRISDEWNNLPKEIAEAENLILFLRIESDVILPVFQPNVELSRHV